MPYRTRFAPSPTGFLHLGHAFSALTAFHAAQANAGDFILRIENIDHTRCRSEFEAGIYQDLDWLGLTWEQPVLRQSEHLAEYSDALESLKAMGLLYADLKTRKGEAEQAMSAPQGDHSRSADLASPAWRLSLPAAKARLGARYNRLCFSENGQRVQAVPDINGEIILGRKDIGVAYHLCVVMDDARQGITHIHRGHDLFDATHTQVLLQALLDLPTPAYSHHNIVLDENGRRLAKRKGAKALRDFRADGLVPSDISNLLRVMPKL